MRSTLYLIISIGAIMSSNRNHAIIGNPNQLSWEQLVAVVQRHAQKYGWVDYTDVCGVCQIIWQYRDKIEEVAFYFPIVEQSLMARWYDPNAPIGLTTSSKGLFLIVVREPLIEEEPDLEPAPKADPEPATTNKGTLVQRLIAFLKKPDSQAKTEQEA